MPNNATLDCWFNRIIIPFQNASAPPTLPSLNLERAPATLCAGMQSDLINQNCLANRECTTLNSDLSGSLDLALERSASYLVLQTKHRQPSNLFTRGCAPGRVHWALSNQGGKITLSIWGEIENGVRFIAPINCVLPQIGQHWPGLIVFPLD